MKNFARQTGLSLVEILVALALSAILATALYRIVLGNQQSVALTESFAKTQEVARTVFDLLQYDLRMAGYQGCVNDLTKVESKLDDSSAGFKNVIHNYNQPMEAYDNYVPGDFIDLVDVLPATVTPVSGSDIFVSRTANTLDLHVAKATAPSSSDFQITGTVDQRSKLEEGMVLMISDCQDAHIFAVKAIDPSTGDLNHGTGVSIGPDNAIATFGATKIYDAGAQLLLMNTAIYFIAAKDNDTNSLYRYSSVDRFYTGVDEAQELVPYVENIQFTFSVDSDGDGEPDRYFTAQEISDDGSIDMAQSVFSVHVELTIATELSCGKTRATASCLEPQKFQQVIYIRNSRGRNNG